MRKINTSIIEETVYKLALKAGVNLTAPCAAALEKAYENESSAACAFALKTLIDKTDIGICLALAPDVFAADTMLSFLKQTGRLEKYIV